MLLAAEIYTNNKWGIPYMIFIPEQMENLFDQLKERFGPRRKSASRSRSLPFVLENFSKSVSFSENICAGHVTLEV